jgi:predicted metal-binding membrane protein
MSMSFFEASAKNERGLVLAGLALVVALGLVATLQLGGMLMMSSEGSVAQQALLFFMWWTMMMAMMLPSAAPAILTYAAVSRKMPEKGAPIAVFVAGYVAIWTGFSIFAVALQLLLSERIALSMMMAVSSAVIGGGLLVAAGLYQVSPLKYACLRKCQAPLMFFARHWQKGYAGAFRMGLSHGLYCVGCCWVLMGLLFYGGVMELRWIVGLALYVAAEKLIPAGNYLSRFAGLILVGWGVWIISRAVI